jgi:hypothetical protein
VQCWTDTPGADPRLSRSVVGNARCDSWDFKTEISDTLSPKAKTQVAFLTDMNPLAAFFAIMREQRDTS